MTYADASGSTNLIVGHFKPFAYADGFIVWMIDMADIGAFTVIKQLSISAQELEKVIINWFSHAGYPLIRIPDPNAVVLAFKNGMAGNIIIRPYNGLSELGITATLKPSLQAGIKYAHSKFLEIRQLELRKELGEQWADSEKYKEDVIEGENWKYNRLKLVQLLNEGYTLDALADNNLVVVGYLKDQIREFEGFSELLHEELNGVHNTLSSILLALSEWVQMNYQPQETANEEKETRKFEGESSTEKFSRSKPQKIVLQKRSPGRKVDPWNVETWRIITEEKGSDEAWRDAFDKWCEIRGLSNPGKSERDAFKKAMGRAKRREDELGTK